METSMPLRNHREIVETVLARQRGDPSRLVQILREVQEALGWLSRETLAAIARGLRQSLAQVEGVAGFYSFFHTVPRGRYRVLWSDNITDRMLGNVDLMREMCRKLWVESLLERILSQATLDEVGESSPLSAVTRLIGTKVAPLPGLIKGRFSARRSPPSHFSGARAKNRLIRARRCRPAHAQCHSHKALPVENTTSECV